MTDWIKKDFSNNSGYLTYQGKFVARFKYNKKSVNDFKKFLIANFSTEEYFSRIQKEAPLEILESKGYLLPLIRKCLEENNMLPTVENWKLYIQKQISKHNAV